MMNRCKVISEFLRIVLVCLMFMCMLGVTPSTTYAANITLTLYVHEGSASGPIIVGAQVTGQDGAGNSFSKTTNSNGYVTITGEPGTWSFTASKSGYDTNSWSQSITTTCEKHAYLIKQVTTVTLTLYVHEGSASGPIIVGAQVTGQDGAGNSFSKTTNSNGYVTITGEPGTWSFTASKSGYDTNSWSQSITTTCEKHAYLIKQVTTVTLTLYVHEGSASGPIIVGAQVTGQDGAGNSFSKTTNSNGYVTITGEPGTWSFTASKSGYDTNSWSQSITTTCEKHAYLIKQVTTVTLTLYVHEGSASGPIIVGAQVTGQDGAGNSFSKTTNSNGYVTITGEPGTWSFTASKSGYDTNSWSQSITTTCEKHAYLIKQVTTVTLTLYVHEGSASGPIIVGAQVTGQDGAGNSFSKTTNSNGYVTITGEPGTWSFTASKSGYDTNSWSQSITTTCEKHAYLIKQVTTVTLTLYVHEGSASGPIIVGAQVTGQDGAGNSFSKTTNSNGYVTITGEPGTWSFTASKSGYDTNSWSQSITTTCEKHAYLIKQVTTVTLTLYVHEGSASGPIIVGAQVTGQDGAGNSFSKTTNSNGYVTITGEPGTWSFTASKSGYDTNSWSQSITTTCEKHAYLIKQVTTVTLTLYVHEGSASGPIIVGAQVTGQDGAGNSFSKTTNSNGYVTITGEPGTWSFTASKSGYDTNSWSQSITTTCEKHAYLIKQVTTVTLTLYVHEGSASGPIIVGAQVTGQDGAGNSFSKTTNSNGYVTITGEPGTWSFTASKSGYDTNSWSQSITTTCEKHAYLIKQVTTVTLTLYVHEGSASGPIIVGAQVTGQDGAGNSFSKTTNSNGYVTITGEPGTWSFTASKSGYDTNSWSQSITTTCEKHAYLIKQVTTVTLTLYVHEGSASGPIIVGAQVTGQDGAGNSFSKTTNSNGYVTITGEPGTWSFTASKSGYDTNSWSQSITTTCEKHAYLIKQVTTVTLTLYVHEGSASGPIIVGAQVTGQDGAGNSFSKTTNSNGYVTITGEPGTWSFTASKSGYDTNSWSQSITTTCEKHAYLIKQVTTVTLTLYVHEGSASGPIIVGAQVTGQDGAGNSFSKTTNSNGYVTITGEPGTWSFTASKSGYDTNSWSQSITTTCEKHAYLIKQVTTVTLTLYVHEGSASGPIIVGAQVTGQDGAGNSFSKTTNSNGYVTITGEPGTWSFTASKSGYDTNSWSQSITTTCEKHAYLIKQTVTLTLTSLTPSSITTSASTYDAELTAAGANLNNVNQVTFTWSGPDSGIDTWDRGDSDWNSKVTANSDTSMTLRLRVLYNESGTQSKTWTWTVKLRDTTGATASETFTITYLPRSPATNGIDTATDISDVVDCFRGKGILLVGRYFSTNAWKVIKKEEAQKISDADMYIVSIWQESANYPEYFSYNQGKSDGENAFEYAAEIGQTPNTPVYFAVDFDATSEHKQSILDYFRGVKDGYEEYLKEYSITYKIGVYGSYWVLNWLKEQRIATYFYQAYASGWSGGENGNPWPDYNIRQISAPQTLCGIEVDYDNASSEFGGWSLTTGQASVAKLVITSPLRITRKEVTSGFCSNTVGGPCFLDIPTLPYFRGDTLTAAFTVENMGSAPISLDKLGVGGRFNNGTLPDGQYPDFSFESTVLNPGDSYSYGDDLQIPYAGDYHFFCAYETSDGEWNTSIDLGEGLTDEDRIEDIKVEYIASLQPSSDAVIEITNMSGISTKELYDVIKLVLDIDTAKSKVVGQQNESLLEDVNLLLDQLDPGKRTVRTHIEPELPEGTWLELQVIEKAAAPALGAGLVLVGFALLQPEFIAAGTYLLVLAEPISQLGSITEMLSMEIGQKVFGKGFASVTVKDPVVGRMDVLWLGPPMGKIVVNIYLAKAEKKGSIVISVGQWLNELKMKWGINAQSTEPIWNAFAYPPDNILGDPQSIIDHVQIIGFKSPGELRVYDSQGRVTGLIDGAVKEEIPNSVYDSELKTVVLFSPTDTYLYEVVGTTEGTYGLEVTSVVDGEATTFAATDIPTTPGAMHQYVIDWDTFSEGEQGLTIQIDSDGDDVFEETKILQPPIASFDVSPGNIYVNAEVDFDASQSSDVDGEIVSYQWNFGDGDTSAGEMATHAYSVPGEYLVSLVVVDNDGVVSTHSRTIQVGEEQNIPIWLWLIIGMAAVFLVAIIVRGIRRAVKA